MAYEFAISNYEATTSLQSLILSNTPTNMKISHDEYSRLQNQNPLTFWTRHACRVGVPPALQDAMAHLGTVWMGMDVVLDYAVKPLSDPATTRERFLPATLIVSGSNDFGYKISNQDAWKEFIPGCESMNFENGGHYPFYEDGFEFGHVVESFLSRVDSRIES